ncbi:MAG: prepilin-type N-terminal cleavage/methylation domain-containing protein [Candidatus Magasanikbacteria bacterium]|nr:prepilin-type N-terminal cleavage/methylation domain-containing protein [Candidatus Magasanikbacteria bacterium]
MLLNHHHRRGFTLLEVLLTIAIIAILAGIVIVAINPGKQLADARNARRRAEVQTILNAVNQYMIDNSGNLPATFSIATCNTASTQEVCQENNTTCTSLGKVNLTVLTTDQKYLPALPVDPKATTSGGTGYYITQSANSRITVCAPLAEQGATISITR